LFIVKENLTLTIPNPHDSDISVGLLSRILKQADISKEIWESL
jgi:predicted RNA binding protein YcfA (HicA-like mRNA interferase family)